MIRTIFSLTICLITSFNLSAQSKFKVGINAAPSYEWLKLSDELKSGPYASNFSGRYRMNGGVLLGYQANERLFIQTGFVYLDKGYFFTGNTYDRRERALHINYLNVPLLLTYLLLNKEKWQFGPTLGLYTGIKLFTFHKQYRYGKLYYWDNLNNQYSGNSYYVGAAAGLSLSHHLTTNWSISFQPQWVIQIDNGFGDNKLSSLLANFIIWKSF